MQQYHEREFNLDIINIVNLVGGRENALTLISVLKGDVTLVLDEQTIRYSAGELAVINRNSAWRLSGKGDNLIIVLTLPSLYLSRFTSNLASWYFKLERGREANSSVRLRQHIAEVAISQLQGNPELGLMEIHSRLPLILRVLTQYCKIPPPAKRAGGYSQRIERVLEWMETHYAENVTLREAAQTQHVTEAYLSRLFSQEVGDSFRSRLADIRLRRVVSEMATSSRALYQIAHSCGFPDIRTFTVLFKKRYGVTPRQFRQTLREGGSNAASDALAADKTLPFSYAELFALLTGQARDGENLWQESGATQTLLINARQLPDKPVTLAKRRYVLAVGKLDEILKSHIQQQIMVARSQLPLGWIEVHQLISGDTIMPDFHTDEQFPTWSRYSNADLAISFLHRAGIGLLVRIRDENLLSDEAGYQEKLLAFIHHCVLMFGEEYVHNWRFIVMAGADAQSDPQAFSARFYALRERLPPCRIGLAWPFSGHNARLEQSPLFAMPLLHDVDFLGVCANPNEHIDYRNAGETDFAASTRYVEQRLQAVVAQLRARGLQLPLFLQNWNTLTGDTLYSNGSFFRGALLMKTLLQLPEQAETLGFWINSQAQNEVPGHTHIDTSSLALFYDTVSRRPIFHVLALRERLRGQLIAWGEDHLIARDGDKYIVLLTHSVTINPWLSIQQHLLHGYRRHLRFTLDGLEAGVWQVKKHLFDQQNGALYYEYARQHTRYGRDEETMAFISSRAEPTLALSDETVTDSWTVELQMDINAICLFELRRVG